MVEDEEGEIDLEELTSEVPWEFVYDFLPLRSILACRASCTVHTEKCNFVSPEKCVDLLIRAMKQRNIHPAWHLGNENSGGCSSANDDEALRSLLQKWLHVDENKSTAFDILLRCFRVFQFLPEEALIICPEEGDINCMPFDFADGAPKLANSPLPPNLLCPLCRSRCSNGSSTLAFIHLSYNSCVPIMSNRAHISLTYTPGEEEVSDEESSSNGCQEESAGNGPILFKCSTDSNPTNTSCYVENYVIQFDDEKKHALEIHCENCKRFAILSPAHTCATEDSSISYCAGPNSLQIPAYDKLLLVRSKCGISGCFQSVYCKGCCRAGPFRVGGVYCHRCNTCYCSDCAAVEDERAMIYKCACEQNQRSCKRLKVAETDISCGKENVVLDGKSNDHFYSCLSDQEEEHRLKDADNSSYDNNDDDDEYNHFRDSW